MGGSKAPTNAGEIDDAPPAFDRVVVIYCKMQSLRLRNSWHRTQRVRWGRVASPIILNSSLGIKWKMEIQFPRRLNDSWQSGPTLPPSGHRGNRALAASRGEEWHCQSCWELKSTDAYGSKHRTPSQGKFFLDQSK